MKILLLIVPLIFLYELYWPVPDKDREHYEYYCNKVVKDKVIPKEELIYFRITTEDRLNFYKMHRPVLNAGEKKIISKFELWLHAHEHSLAPDFLIEYWTCAPYDNGLPKLPNWFNKLF